MCSDNISTKPIKCSDIRANCNESLPVQELIKRMLETTNHYNKGNTVDMAKFYELEKKFT